MHYQHAARATRRETLRGALMLGIASALPSTAARAAGTAIAATIDTGKPGQPISKFIYGGFIEHIGDLINHSYWSEVLDDRKFYYPVDSQPLPKPAGEFPFGRRLTKWTPIGPDAAVTMDKTAPFVGEHSPRVELSGSATRGIQQRGLALEKKGYVGRIVVSAPPGVQLKATLVWGKGAGDRQTNTIPASQNWTTVPLNFEVKKATNAGQLEISGTGTGWFKIGAISLMPADNIHGFRRDTIELTKQMDCGLIRLPGGNFVSGYDWKDTVGDPDKRAPTFEPVWNAVQPNDVGVDELLVMCQLMNTEPYWCVSTGFGEPRNQGELVEYVNGDTSTPMGKLRAANGHPEPYRVKYWNIGNETYGHWQFGHMSLEQYVIKHNLTADAMRKADPGIFIIASGAMPDEMTVTQAMPSTPDKTQVQFGSDRDWTGGLLAKSWGKFDAIAQHAYPYEGKRFDLLKADYVKVDEPLIDATHRLANRIRLAADEWEEYKKRFPALNEKKIVVSLDEWAYTMRQDLTMVLCIATAFHEMFRHTDFLTMAAYTMAQSWLDFDRTRSTFSGAGLVFQLYNRHFGNIPVSVGGNVPMPAPKWPVGGDQPSVNAGSATYPLDVTAALSTNHKILTVAVVNATDEIQEMALDFAGFTPGPSGLLRRLSGNGLHALNRVGHTPEITVTELPFNTAVKKIAVEPLSIELYEIPAA